MIASTHVHRHSPSFPLAWGVVIRGPNDLPQEVVGPRLPRAWTKAGMASNGPGGTRKRLTRGRLRSAATSTAHARLAAGTKGRVGAPRHSPSVSCGEGALYSHAVMVPRRVVPSTHPMAAVAPERRPPGSRVPSRPHQGRTCEKEEFRDTSSHEKEEPGCLLIRGDPFPLLQSPRQRAEAAFQSNLFPGM